MQLIYHYYFEKDYLLLLPTPQNERAAMKKILIIVLLLIIIKPILAQQNTVPDTISCDSPEARQFDFWIGDWNIKQKMLQNDGSWISLDAKTSVKKILNGCALEEYWKGEVKYFWSGMNNSKYIEAISIRYFDTKKMKWHIQWIDNSNLVMGPGFDGNFENGKGVFYSETVTAKGKQISRIIFSDIKKNSVLWKLSISRDEGKIWIDIWLMDMQRVNQ